ncbi:alpha-amylase/pullulanase [Streptomyces sp. NBRC 110611]|uniref:hypothetical protein n=1 Tax=Streptomyces sp. NBRC 110611 TaxID=1621259 RepID=UPI00083450AC|nr:hypothetical protein [Streptomyces sp. NBRC 110611]GAU65139.1 alpha-amylase/pullulanase [Streptomyces sp. NBRC 110611]
MTARRPLLTAATAGSVLFALWFVPSANAIVGIDGAKDSSDSSLSGGSGLSSSSGLSDGSGLNSGSGLHTDSESAPGTPELAGGPGRTGRTGSGDGAERRAQSGGESGSPGSGSTAPQRLLADTGSPDTTPYVIGGTVCLMLGAGLVGYSVRRTRHETP